MLYREMEGREWKERKGKFGKEWKEEKAKENEGKCR